MSISELYESGTQKNNIAHFAAITKIASIDGEINYEEKELLAKFANKLDINEEQFAEITKNPHKYPIIPANSKEERLMHLFDLFKMIFADHFVDQQEVKLIHKYAIGLGCSEERAKDVIKKSIKIFSGKIDFEDYQYLIEKG
ncbi:TerB family tellurite resistance protein [Aquimarina latercula]|uniref:tellurite resistance TerB family protein n=1 Tax=Aquimarina latercula TaxID=987 RepID=UPI0003FB244A|nr:TerB family tellurite resistance protein [Aquimarina latercula]